MTRASGAGAVGASGDGCEVAKEVGHFGPRERVQRASQAYLMVNTQEQCCALPRSWYHQEDFGCVHDRKTW